MREWEWDEELGDDVLDVVICRLFGRNQGIDPELKELLQSYIQEVCLRVMHYCHVETLSSALSETLAAMTIDLLKSEGVPLKGAALNAALESVRLGDAQFGFGQASSVSQAMVDQWLRSYAADLHPYRQMAR